MGIIYKITNKLNNKIYIGQTVTSMSNRWNQHIQSSFNLKAKDHNCLIHLAIYKYGIENFSCEEIEEVPNEQLNDREIYWIKIFNSYFKNNFGYNMTYGGGGSTRYSDDDIINLWNQGYSSTQISNILNINKNTVGYRLQGLVGADAVLERKRLKASKAVIQYDLMGNLLQVWSSANMAEKQLNLPIGSICRCCKKQRTKSGNFLWKYADDDITIEELMVNYAKSTQCNDVYLIKDNQPSIYYNTAAEAERALQLSHGKVSEICNHKYGRKSAKGYVFEWAYPLKKHLII